MAKMISQDTFNNVVKENMELFDMKIDSAIIEAKNQFEAQGVNLFNIITDQSMFKYENDEIIIGIHQSVLDLNGLKDLLLKENIDFTKVENYLNSIQKYYQSDIAYRIMAAKNEGIITLENALKNIISFNNKSTLNNCLLTICYLVTGQPDIVNEEFLKYIVNLVKSDSLDKLGKAIIYRILFQCCLKHEGNRQILINSPNCIIPITVNQLDLFGSKSKELAKDICLFLRSLILDDDIRVTFGRGTENAKMIVTETNCLDVLLKLCIEYKERETEGVVVELFYTLDKLSVRNEFCQRILDLGGVDYIIEALENHINSQKIVTSSFAVLKSLAANDKVKVEIGKKNGLGLMIRGLDIHIHNQSTCVNGFGALSAVSLRTLENSRSLVQMGLPQLLKQAIQIHADKKHFDVLRPVCLTTRNVVARCPELVADMLEAGLEEWLNVVLKLGRECDDEAKAALRDLGCKVDLKEPWTGKMGVKVNN